jgi:hypothetical protein
VSEGVFGCQVRGNSHPAAHIVASRDHIPRGRYLLKREEFPQSLASHLREHPKAKFEIYFREKLPIAFIKDSLAFLFPALPPYYIFFFC